MSTYQSKFTGAEIDERLEEAEKISPHIEDKANPHETTKTHVGLGNADNTSDKDKPLSDAAVLALGDKVDKVDGKGLSANDYTDDEKTKLADIKAGAEVNPDIADNLTTTIAGKVLDARQGKALSDNIGNQTYTEKNYIADGESATSSIDKLDMSLKETAEQISTKKRTARFVVGTSTAGWTAADCDYLCDGTADDVEINNAITALPATGGEIVILDGTYNITATIDVTKDNVNIRGNGNATILKRMYDSTSPEGVITLTGRSGCKIANLQVDGNRVSYTDVNNYGIYLNASNSNTVTGNTCNNNTAGIYLSHSSDSNTVTGNTCNNNSHGIYLSSSSNNTVTGNTCNNNSSYGIYLSASSDNNTVTGNTCNNNNYGIYLNYSSDSNTVTGNTCNNNSHGIYLSSSSNNIFTGNTCNNNNYGIYLAASSNNTVTGNTCTRGTGLPTDYTASQYTIRLAGTDNNYNLISNNNCMGKAPMVYGGTGNCVYGNKYDSGDYKDFTQDEKTKLAGIEAVLEEIVVVGKTAPDFGIWLEEV